MLLQRLVTALVLIPLVVIGVLQLSTVVLGLILALVVLLGGYEWTRLAGIAPPFGKLLYLTVLTVCMAGAAFAVQSYPVLILPAALLAVLFWCLVAVSLLRYHPIGASAVGTIEKSALGLLVLVLAWLSLLLVHGVYQDGPYLVLFLLVLIWVADSCAYFTGRRWGRIKLAPRISPGKTWEGVYGALAGAALCGVVLFWWRPESGSILMLIFFSVVIALVSIVGDLFESLLKRQSGLKDSGTLLPGHGGVLDRIDSLCAASPLFLCGLQLLEMSR